MTPLSSSRAYHVGSLKKNSSTWISESANPKLSNASDHVQSDQHKLSISLLYTEEGKAQKKAVTANVPIAKSLLVMNKSLEEKIGKA